MAPRPFAILLALAAASMAGCATSFPAAQLPHPPGAPFYWHVHDSSEEEGKVTFRCTDADSMNCADKVDRNIMVLEAARICRDWGYDGLKSAGPNMGWTRPTMEGMKVEHQTKFQCR